MNVWSRRMLTQASARLNDTWGQFEQFAAPQTDARLDDAQPTHFQRVHALCLQLHDFND